MAFLKEGFNRAMRSIFAQGSPTPAGSDPQREVAEFALAQAWQSAGQEPEGSRTASLLHVLTSINGKLLDSRAMIREDGASVFMEWDITPGPWADEGKRLEFVIGQNGGITIYGTKEIRDKLKRVPLAVFFGTDGNLPNNLEDKLLQAVKKLINKPGDLSFIDGHN